MKRIKLIYVLSHAYSGSTLFGLFLGSSRKIKNLSEVVYLEKDYFPKLNWTCGQNLNTCEFWNKIITKTTYDDLNLLDFEKKELQGVVQRGGLWKILLPFFSIRLLNKKKLDFLLRKYEYLFTVIQEEVGDQNFLLDLSKSPEQLDLLLKSQIVDVHVIHLKKNLKTVYHSMLKRPKKTRKKYGFKTIRELLWLLVKDNYNNKIYSKVSNDKKITINFEEFQQNPSQILNRVNIKFKINDNPVVEQINLNNQHVFTGNRWLFRRNHNSISVKPTSAPVKLSAVQNFLFKILFKV